MEFPEGGGRELVRDITGNSGEDFGFDQVIIMNFFN
jgi:hypothetical protein